MTHLTQTTQSTKSKNIKRGWYLIDLKGEVLGRVSTKISGILQGKHKVNYVPYLDMGDNVVVINAKKAVLTGKKAQTKIYLKYSGYPGGQKQTDYLKLIEKNPAKVVRQSVSGMLPKNKLRDKRLSRLHIFPDESHDFAEKFK